MTKPEATKATRASAIRNQLYEEIVTGHLPPDSKLHIGDLCDRFNTTLSPVREALNRLVPEGLVRQSDHRGFVVSPVSIDEMVDLTTARCQVNEIALRESIAKATPEWEENLLLAQHRLSRTPRSDGDEALHRAWSSAHRSYHSALIGGCRSRWITDFCDHTFVASERYRHIGRRSGRYSYDRDSHPPITAAALERDADTAVALLTAHFQDTMHRVRAVLSGEQDKD